MSTENDHQLRDAVMTEFTAAGYSLDQIKLILDRQEGLKHESEEMLTWIKIHRRHLLPETLAEYNLNWDWDENDSNYLLIKEWVDEEFQDELFEHTKRLRDKMQVEMRNLTKFYKSREAKEFSCTKRDPDPRRMYRLYR
ncbi:hypothetical protein BDV26DRAFT_297841 [Aspergillus bertholletiae]|uniref:Uncharacterized protein n=1 Tax=Aspergillus bertholletiae TaxID=1226010 RepID=A0A5N7ARV8_9EURO|nr:hypothetical protein BDV26DRAFT_297841 [Aspergillus bertholletiae]